MNNREPAWVQEAASKPLAFAQVREDPAIDLQIAQELGGARVLMVASGGCTAAALVGSAAAVHLHLVDPNPAQLALTLLKIHLATSADETERMRILGHAPMSDRAERLAEILDAIGEKPDALGPPAWVAEVGPDHAGRYELAFAALRARLEPVRVELDDLLALRDPMEQTRRIEPQRPLGAALDEALDEVLSLPNLVRLFGEGATRNPVEPFARHFARRIRHVFATLPAADNPYLWQMLRGIYPSGGSAPWFRLPSATVPEITTSNRTMLEVLSDSGETFDFVHLSNILDWVSPDEARMTLELSAQVLSPGGVVLIRQLNSTLDIPALGPAFDWDRDGARILHESDRSFFYRALHLGRKR